MTTNIPKQEVMPFGKHKGTALKDLKVSYVVWLLSLETLNKNLRKAWSYYQVFLNLRDAKPTQSCLVSRAFSVTTTTAKTNALIITMPNIIKGFDHDCIF